MLSALALTLMGSQVPKPIDVTAPITSASVFKNGFVVVVREIKVGAAGTYALEKIPQSAMGTMWFSSSEGTTLESISTRNIETSYRANLGSLDEITRSNVGKALQFTFKDEKGGRESIEGVLKSADGEILVVDTTNRGTLVIPKAGLISLSGEQGKVSYSVERKNSKKVLELRTSGGPGRVEMLSLERGLSWSAAYAVDVSDKKELKLTAKSTLVNDFEDLNKVELKLITGFPNLPFATMLEPLITGAGSMDAVSQFGVQAGGFGGGGGRGNALAMNSQVAAPMMQFDASMAAVPGAGGEQREDLFFYKLPNSTLGTGQRTYRALFSMKSPYKDIYTWDAQDFTQDNARYQPIPEGPQDVWHALRFRNTSGQPLTTAVATTLDGGEIIGQDMLGYVPAGADTELKINKSLDIRAEATEAELSRERGAIKDVNGNFRFDLVTIKGTLEVTNMKSNEVNFRIRRFVTGEVTDNGGSDVFKNASGLGRMNANSRLTWIKDLKPGAKISLNYIYRMYVYSG
jgi:hypothetical protein